MKISFIPLKLTEQGTLVFGVTSNKKLGKTAEKLDKKSGGLLRSAMRLEGFEGKPEQYVSLMIPHKKTALRVLLLGVGDAKKLTLKSFENMGGHAVKLYGKAAGSLCVIAEPPATSKIQASSLAAHIALGAKLASYSFDIYKKKKDTRPKSMSIAAANPLAARKLYNGELSAVADGVFLARSLVNEPANVLHPSEFAKRAAKLKAKGVKVEVLNETQMKKLGMLSLLSVGQGSAQPSKMVVMQWNGGRKGEKPLAFIGKGVCFDTGGISIKPSARMDEMKGDMGGAACVTGLMLSLASRKAKANIVGVIGLAENMPSSKASRPGDIVRSMSGQTIEILNTDAEGRLVLADALWYTQKRFKPQFMIDLATLTGAILVALGQEYAGLFSNNDTLSKRLVEIGDKEGERLWRMPLCDEFDKMIDTPNADVQNIGRGRAGSSTAAHFLQRFVNKVPWVHLDIAGVAMGSPKTLTNPSWGSGFGVRLLDRFVRKYYEKAK